MLEITYVLVGLIPRFWNRISFNLENFFWTLKTNFSFHFALVGFYSLDIILHFTLAFRVINHTLLKIPFLVYNLFSVPNKFLQYLFLIIKFDEGET